MKAHARSRTPDANHPLIVAQQKNLGPLSPAGKEVWHGNATPCVTCGQLLPRLGGRCDHCGQDHGADLLQKMARHSGPWFVYDHARPFPGVSLERICKLIDRQGLTRTSIIRGPTTYYQWRFAGETPLIAPLLGYCWNCQARVPPGGGGDCPACGVAPGGRGAGPDEPQAAQPPDDTDPEELQALADVAAARERTLARIPGPAPVPLERVSLLFFAITMVVVLTLVVIAKTSS